LVPVVKEELAAVMEAICTIVLVLVVKVVSVRE
jgi:hypothetical protein